jgi:Flp pilus assembly CpaF family ATPase
MSDDRTPALVRTFLGRAVCDLLVEPDVMDILVRPFWIAVDRSGRGLSLVPEAVGTVDILGLLRLLAPLVGQEVPVNTIVESSLPGYRARFAGAFLGPRGEHSFFTLRRAIVRGLPLSAYVEQGIFGQAAYARFREIVADPLSSLLVAGPTGSGKTTFLASMLTDIVQSKGHDEHLVLVEDTPELFVDGPMITSFTASTNFPYRAALRAALRHRPTRLIVGEVRGGEGLDAIKAGATGHGLMMTIHANTIEGAVRTLAARMAEGTEGHIDEQLIPDAIHTIAVFRRQPEGIRLTDLGSISTISPLIAVERIPVS